MRRFSISAAAAVLLVAGAAHAQSPSAIRVGQTVNGTLELSDTRAAEDAYLYDPYVVTAQRGQRFEVILRGEGFDAYLEVFAPGETEAPLAIDDDGLGEDTHARLRFVAQSDGEYVIRARNLEGTEGGDYTLSLSERPAARQAPRPGSIRLGQTVRGQLAANDPETDVGVPYDAFSWRGRVGERVLISLDSNAFDPLVIVGRNAAGTFEELARNDDGADSELNSRLIFTATDTEHLIRVTAVNPARTGAYTLKLEPGPAQAAALPIEIGGSVDGRLTTGTKATDAATNLYRFQGQEGQRIRIELTSPDFDTFVELFDDDRNSLASDDDGAAEGTNSRINFTLPRTGAYLVEARAFSDATGAYTLAISELAAEPEAPAIAFGAKLEGEIGEGDARDEEDRGFDAYRFSGSKGQRVQATMRSGDFDTYLQISSADGEFDALASDDDGLGEGTDSQLNFTLPEDGDYILRASPLGSEDKGLYSLELTDRGPQPQAGSMLLGTVARGLLSETDATADDNSHFDAYRITLRKDEKLLITMVSNEVDSFIAVGRMQDDGTFERLASDDDGLSDTHAKLEWTVPDDGEYEIRAGTFQKGQTGAYALNVEKSAD